jgi:hypothetical protein
MIISQVIQSNNLRKGALRGIGFEAHKAERQKQGWSRVACDSWFLSLNFNPLRRELSLCMFSIISSGFSSKARYF